MTKLNPADDPHPELRKPYGELTEDEKNIERQERADGAVPRRDDGTRYGEPHNPSD